ncbi:MAG TPA: aminomethyl transferase family protein [Planctomycetes bacterium]|nr:aminomethyl transferase family protein [Planctomycetota bacterium]
MISSSVHPGKTKEPANPMNTRDEASRAVRSLSPTEPSDPSAEALAGRRAAVLHLLDQRGLMEIRGRAAPKLLHGQTTQDILALDDGAGTFALQLNRKARLQAPMVIRRLASDRMLVELPVERLEPTFHSFAPFAMLDDCELVDMTASTLLLHLSGPSSDDVLAACVEGDFVPELPAYHHLSCRCAGVNVMISPGPETGEKGWRILVPADGAVAVASRLLEETDNRLAAQDSWRILTREAGWPEWGLDLDDTRLVPECNLPWAVSTTKGCYVGQEIVARVRTYGKVNRCLMGLRSTSLLPAGSLLQTMDGGEAGEVTSSCLSPHLESPIAMAFVRKTCLEPGTRVLAVGDGGPWEAEVTTLPFVPRRFWCGTCR